MSISVLSKARLFFGVMAVTAFSALVLVGCGKDEDKPDPVGPPSGSGGKVTLPDSVAWITEGAGGVQSGYVFRSDSVLLAPANVSSLIGWTSAEAGTWSVNGNILKMTLTGTTTPIEYTYSVSGNGNTLTLTLAGTTTPITYTKTNIGIETDPDGEGPGTDPGNPGTGGNLVLGANEAWTASDEDGDYGVIFQTNNDFVNIYKYEGSWYGEVIGTWAASGGNITLTINDPDEGPSTMTGTYSVSGSALTATIDGKTQTFTKTSGVIVDYETNPGTESFTDSRDNKTYKKVTIGTQTWMGENLNYDIPNVTRDVCYDNSADSCAKYGRLYTWSDALTACPAGWHLSSNDEWEALTDFIGSSAAKKLKSATGWQYYGDSYVGTDDYEFSALPGGESDYSGSFNDTGRYGYWWSATEWTDTYAWCQYMYNGYQGVSSVNNRSKVNRFSVRCVQD